MKEIETRFKNTIGWQKQVFFYQIEVWKMKTISLPNFERTFLKEYFQQNI